jgi:alpha-tubulin suppressor-like RCC1 family protein
LVAVVFAAGSSTSAVGAPPATPQPSPGDARGAAARPLSLLDARKAAATGQSQSPAKAAAGVSATATSGGSGYTSISPARVLDTRNGIGAPKRPVPAGGSITVNLTAQVPATATAVILNVTAVTTSATYVTAWPAGEARPNVSSLNVDANKIRPNAVTVALGANRSVSLYNNTGNTNLLADLAGYYVPGTGSKFNSVTPVRVLNTLGGQPVGPGATRVLDLSSRVPATATAVTFNLTGVTPTTSTYVTAWPTGSARPNASNLNLVAGEITPNQVTVRLGTNRSVSIYNNAGNTHLLADLAGYYDTAQGDAFYQLTPIRTFDSRPGNPVSGGTSVVVSLAPDLPPSASSVVFNFTGLAGTTATYLTTWPAGSAMPAVSNLNLTANQIASNLTTVRLGTDRGLSFYNNSGQGDFLADIAGYFAPAPAACAASCVRTWGDNFFGQLGVGTTGGSSSAPGRVDGLSATAAAASLVDGYALDGTGKVWAWGNNDLMGLGNGQQFGSNAMPAQVPGLDAITQISTGAYTTYALNVNNVAYAWGDGTDGSIGDGGTTSRPNAVRLPITDAVQVVELVGGYTTGYALDSTGAVWAWGANAGSLGNGTYGTGCDQVPVGAGCRSATPIQVPGLTAIVDIEATLNATYAIKSDGTVYAWGWNAEGELGNGTVGGPACYTNPTGPNCVAVSPVEVPALFGIDKIVHGSSSTTYGVTTDGKVKAWGWNAQGQLGNGTAGGTCSTPTQPNCVATTPQEVPGLTGVSDVMAGDGFVLARKSDGTVWSWGSNEFGQIGVPGPNPRSTPAQVAGLSGATAIGAGGQVSVAVQ